jgi:hypothetical protein
VVPRVDARSARGAVPAGNRERYDEADARKKDAIVALAVAKNRDAQEQPPQDSFVSPTQLTRLGFVYPPTIPRR